MFGNMLSENEKTKEELKKFFELILETKEILVKLKKYKGNPHYKTTFLIKINEINRAYKFVSARISKSSNPKLKKEFSKINGSIEAITKYKNSQSSLEEINWIEEHWPNIEIVIDETESSLSQLEDKNIHPEILLVSEKLFNDGHYAQAIEEAFKKIVLLVKQKSGREDLDGCGLMTTSFSKNSPILKFNQLKNRIDQDEQEGWMHLYVGAVLGIRDVKAHGNIIQKDPIKTLEYLSFASLLCRRLDETTR